MLLHSSLELRSDPGGREKLSLSLEIRPTFVIGFGLAGLKSAAHCTDWHVNTDRWAVVLLSDRAVLLTRSHSRLGSMSMLPPPIACQRRRRWSTRMDLLEAYSQSSSITGNNWPRYSAAWWNKWTVDGPFSHTTSAWKCCSHTLPMSKKKEKWESPRKAIVDEIDCFSSHIVVQRQQRDCRTDGYRTKSHSGIPTQNSTVYFAQRYRMKIMKWISTQLIRSPMMGLFTLEIASAYEIWRSVRSSLIYLQYEHSVPHHMARGLSMDAEQRQNSTATR